MLPRVKRWLCLPLSLVRGVVLNFLLTLFSNIPPLRSVSKMWYKTLVKGDDDTYMKPVLTGIAPWSLFWVRTKDFLYSAWAEVQMVAEQGGRAPNPKLLRFSDRSECHLLDVASKGRPLIVNFGSCT